MKNLENACIQARRHNLAASGVGIFLKTQDYKHFGSEIKLAEPSAFPLQMSETVSERFTQIFRPGLTYRATGVILFGLKENADHQMNLFGNAANEEKMKRIYSAIDSLSNKLGKHTVRMASTTAAHSSDGRADRNKKPLRKIDRLPGESNRKHLTVPVLNFRLK